MARHQILFVKINYIHKMGTAVAQWFRRCATNRKVAGWVPDPSDRTMALGSTQSLTEMSTKSISGR